jgi:hypothetical protein
LYGPMGAGAASVLMTCFDIAMKYSAN